MIKDKIKIKLALLVLLVSQAAIAENDVLIKSVFSRWAKNNNTGVCT